MAFPSSFMTSLRPTARMTAGLPTRQGVGQIYLMLVKGCLERSRNTLLPQFPCFSVETLQVCRSYSFY